MTAHYEDGPVQVWHGDCIDVMREMPDNSVDAVVTDPPYGLEFMGKEWDRPWQNRNDNPAGAGLSKGGYSSSNGYANRETPTYGRAWANKRCTKCGHIASGGSPCTCPDPEWVMERGDTTAPMKAFQAWCEEWAREAYRLLKPGGHLLAFGGTRTFHRLASGIEDAGFEIRDSIAWLYGSGFPKSLDVSKAIDKAAGAERSEVIGSRGLARWKEGAPGGAAMKDDGGIRQDFDKVNTLLAPVTEDAARWNGWGTALKPAFEPIVVARKPLQGTVAANVLAYGTGALNIDGSRIGTTDDLNGGRYSGKLRQRDDYTSTDTAPGAVPLSRLNRGIGEFVQPAGRWPANVVLDASQAAALDQQSGTSRDGVAVNRNRSDDNWTSWYGTRRSQTGEDVGYGGEGGASRFFYTAKASTDERPSVDGIAHPTVKPVDLMRWLVKLVTPPGGVILEPFAGSGTTVEAAVLEGFHCIAIEREADYLPLILQRIRKPHAVGLDFGEWEA